MYVIKNYLLKSHFTFTFFGLNYHSSQWKSKISIAEDWLLLFNLRSGKRFAPTPDSFQSLQTNRTKKKNWVEDVPERRLKQENVWTHLPTRSSFWNRPPEKSTHVNLLKTAHSERPYRSNIWAHFWCSQDILEKIWKYVFQLICLF